MYLKIKEFIQSFKQRAYSLEYPQIMKKAITTAVATMGLLAKRGFPSSGPVNNSMLMARLATLHGFTQKKIKNWFFYGRITNISLKKSPNLKCISPFPSKDAA